MKMNELVSVIIVSYNSSKFVEETLESVLNQSWNNIELIITDDGSKDNTVTICRNWINHNKSRFFRTDLLTSETNTGIPANLNRGLKIATGEWVCFPAADDTLKPNCIQDNMNWISLNPGIKVLFSYVDVFKNTFEERNFIQTTPGNPFNQRGIMAKGRTAESQYKMLLLADRIHFTPSLFIQRETLLSVGGFDERFRLLEDHPLWLKLTRNGHKLWFMNKITVNYRQHINAVNNVGCSFLVNPNYFKSENFRKIYIYPNLPLLLRLNMRFEWYIHQLFRLNWLNKTTKLNQLIHSIITVYLNPFKYLLWLRKQFNKEIINNEYYS